MIHLPEGVDYQYKGGIPGLYDEKGRLIKKAEDLTPQQLSDFERDYRRRRGSAQINVDRQVQELERKSQEAKRKAEAESKAKAEAKAKNQPPAGTAQPPRTGQPPASTTTAPPRQPAPESPAVREYMRAAAAARKSGDTAQMAKVRDTGLDIWRKKYAGTLAKNVTPAGTQKGTGQSVMAKQADELRNLRPPVPAPGNEKPGYSGPPTPTGPQAQSSLPGGAYSSAATAKMTTRTKNILGVKEQYDAYDLVLEYLLSEGHADTIEEAHYVMLQMDAEHIQNIVESPGEWFRGIFNPNNSVASKAQNTSPFSRPTTPLPSYTSPFAKPGSRDDSGKLTTYGAGGGAAAERAGKSRAEVMRQGAKNLENKKPVNQGPDFGR